MKRQIRYVGSCIAMMLGVLCLATCGGGGAGGNQTAGVCNFTVAATPQALSAADVEQLIAQAVQASDTLGAAATIAVVDRVGNVLGVYRMSGADATVAIRSGRNIGAQVQGLDGLSGLVGSDLAAIAKAITGAYLSSSGNAFSTRTAGYIVQDHFPPAVANTASGPLFGVQFSQLPCGDLVTRGDDVGAGPKRSPLGLSADPGGFPIYKNGQVVGGIGVLADGVYGIDLNPADSGSDLDERIAQSAVSGFSAPPCIRADHITVNGISLAYSNSDNALVAVSAAALSDLKISGRGSLLAVAGYAGLAAIRAGTALGNPASGVTADPLNFAANGGQVLVGNPGTANRYPPSASSTPPPADGNGMGISEVREILNQALAVANQSRAQIRQPVGSAAQVSIAVVDAGGNLLGLVRSPDAPVFGIDVSLQKARTAAFFSSPTAAGLLAAQADANYFSAIGVASGPFGIASYINSVPSGARRFFGDAGVFADGKAFSARSIANISQPNFPDGITGAVQGPFSKPATSWSVFNTGLQLDLVYTNFIQAILTPDAVGSSCTATGADGLPGIKNGIQVFPGAVPIYRGSVLVGAIGVSGDGVDQDDMVSFLGLARAASTLNSGIANAPTTIRADRISPQGIGLRYAQCPQSPFNGSDQQNVCNGL